MRTPIRVKADDARPHRSGRTRRRTRPQQRSGHLVCAQAGEVNTGCFDPFPALTEICRGHDAWLHVDGAVGLWAAASREFDSPD